MTDTVGRQFLDQEELAARRTRVIELHLQQYTGREIAKRLGLNDVTVCRDLQWVRQHWRERYGLKPSVDPAEVVGKAFAFYEHAQAKALRVLSRLIEVKPRRRKGKRQPAATLRAASAVTIHAAMACLREARAAQRAQVDLLQDLGIIDRALGSLNLGLPTAKALRQLVRDAAVTDDMLISDAERRLRRHLERPS